MALTSLDSYEQVIMIIVHVQGAQEKPGIIIIIIIPIGVVVIQ